MKNLLRKIAQILRDHDLYFTYAEKSYAQEGEDMLLRRIFKGNKSGFYVDVGAHHPMRFSNTYFFYKQGWRGVNIDAMPDSMKLFNKTRSKDINLEAAVSKQEGSLKFYMLNDPALNTFSSELVNSYVQSGYEVIDTRTVQTRPLSSILEENIPSGTKIDFMSIDVEGEDINVLESNDWDRFKPDYILIEILGLSSFEQLMESNENEILSKNGYEFFAKTVNTVFFKNRDCDI